MIDQEVSAWLRGIASEEERMDRAAATIRGRLMLLGDQRFEPRCSVCGGASGVGLSNGQWRCGVHLGQRPLSP